MPTVQVIGDANNAGGIITQVPSVAGIFAGDIAVAVEGSRGTGHPPCEGDIDPPDRIHCNLRWITLSSRRDVTAGDIAIIVAGDSDSCGHVRVGGSSNIFIGD